MTQPKRILEFDGFRVDLTNHLLLRDAQAINLTPKAFDTLAVLVERRGELVEKDELLSLVWPGTFVEEATLTQNVYTLRKALAEAGGTLSYIETVPRRGYRFAVPITEAPLAAVTVPVALDDLSELVVDTEPSAPPVAATPAERPAAWRRVVPAAALVPALILASVVLTGLLGWRLLGRAPTVDSASTAPAAIIRSVAVLPFEPLTTSNGSAGEDAYLGLGMADALIGRLSSLRQLVVRPTSAVRRYTGPNRDLGAIARELKVDAVLDGTFQRAGERLRVSVQLVGDAEAPLWAAQYDTIETGLFEVQDSISQRLAEELRLEFTRQEWDRLSRHQTQSREAYEHYVRGRFFWNRRSQEGLARAIESFRAAIALDDRFALAYAGLADCYVLQPLFSSERPDSAFEAALENAERALALDDELAEAHTSRAYARFVYQRAYTEAEQGFRRAIEENPSYPTAHQWYAFLLAALGRHDEAIAHAQRAIELDPLSLVINADGGMVLLFARRSGEAQTQFQRALDLDPSFAYARFGLGHAQLQQGRFEAAIAELTRASQLSGGNSAMRASLAYAQALAGQRAEAAAVDRSLAARALEEYVDPSHFAFIALGLGDKPKALAALGRAIEERSRFVAFLGTWSVYDPLREEPGWGPLLSAAGLQP
jgi:DNA-binding winged helix-turn-helix (wHTH) protein/TolB-like protein/Tfp pilus assembly protein PilF